jgi:hypothetical protein
MNHRTVVFAPHDDGSGAFGVLCRLARALVRRADENKYALHLYFLNSSMADGGQELVNRLLVETENEHTAAFMPTDNLIRLPKDPQTGSCVIGSQIPCCFGRHA